MALRMTFALSALAILTGCDNGGGATGPAPAARDVQFYLDNPEDRRAAIAECDNDPGSLGDSANCVNAYEADEEALNRSIRDALGQD